MDHRKDLQRTLATLTVAAALFLTAPAPAAAAGGEGSGEGVWGWLVEVWTEAEAGVAAALDAFRDQGAGLDPNG